MKNFFYISGIVTISLLFFSCENKRSDILAAVTKSKLMPTQRGKNITMTYTDSARIRMVITAKSTLAFEKDVKEPFTVMPEGVNIDFYNGKLKPEATLKANYGIMYPVSKRMEVKYNVELVNKDGAKLNTEHLFWDESKKMITSNAFVKITTDKEIIMGKGLEANQDFTQYQIKEVTGTIQMNGEDL